MGGIPSIPATAMTSVPIGRFGHAAPPVRVSQIRVGVIPWYCAPGVALLLPNQPLASMTTLMMPAALNTQSDVGAAPREAGPSSTITRLASTTPGKRLSVDVPVMTHRPLELVGKRLR